MSDKVTVELNADEVALVMLLLGAGMCVFQRLDAKPGTIDKIFEIAQRIADA